MENTDNMAFCILAIRFHIYYFMAKYLSKFDSLYFDYETTHIPYCLELWSQAPRPIFWGGSHN